MKFALGTITVSFAASSALRAANVHLHDLLERHVSGDAGESIHEDWALTNGEQLVSCYILPRLGVSLLVVTEGDRRQTFVGFWEECGR